MSDAMLWFIAVAVGILSVLAIAGLVYAIVCAAHHIREVLDEARAAGAGNEKVMLLNWLIMLVAAVLIIGLIGLLISVVMALTGAWQETLACHGTKTLVRFT